MPACGNIPDQYSPALIRRAQEGRADGSNHSADLQAADQCAKPGPFDGQPFFSPSKDAWVGGLFIGRVPDCHLCQDLAGA